MTSIYLCACIGPPAVHVLEQAIPASRSVLPPPNPPETAHSSGFLLALLPNRIHLLLALAPSASAFARPPIHPTHYAAPNDPY